MISPAHPRTTARINLWDHLLPPLMFKDARMSLRRKRAAVLQMLFLGSCFLATWVLWPQEGIYSLSSQSAHHLFTVLGIGQLALVVLFAPAFTSPAFAMERERNTFDLLYGTRMSPFAIAWGKISGSLCFLMLVVLSTIPVVSTCLVLGGVTAQAVVWFYVILVLTAVLFGLIGLTVSVLSQKTYLAVIYTYVFILGLSVVVTIPSLLFIGISGPSVRAVLHHLWSLSPFVAVANVVQPALLRMGEWAVTLPGAHVIFAVASLLMIAGMLIFLFFHLRRCPDPRPRGELVIDEALSERLTKWPYYLINPRGRRRMIGRFFNPVLIKELRTMLFGRIVYLMRGMYCCVFVSLVLVLLAALSTFLHAPAVIAVLTVSFQMALMLFAAPILSAPLISSELESGRFDLLRLTKLSSFKIISGKFQSVLIPLAILVVATLPPYLALGYVDRSLWPGIVRSTITLLATLLFICSAGMFFSAFSRRTATSIAATYVLVVVTCVMSLVGLLAQQSLSHATLQRLFVVNPVVTMLSETALPSLRESFQLWKPNLFFLLCGSVVLLVGAAVRVGRLVRPS